MVEKTTSSRWGRGGIFRGWLVVLAAGLARGLGAFDSNAATAVLPDIGRDLGVEPDAVQWIVLAYLIPIAALSLSAAKWFGTAGPRPAMILLVCGFAIASVGAGFAPTIESMIAARAIQGVFGAGLFSATIVVALAALPPAYSPRIIALMTTTAAVGAVSGPALGSVIAATWGWPWALAVCGPVGAVVAIAFWLGIEGGRGLPLPTLAMLTDGFLVGIAVTSVLLALTFGPEAPAVFLIAFVAAPALFVWWRRSRSRSIGRLLVVPGIQPVLTAVGCMSVAAMGSQFAISYFARGTAGLSVEQTGTVLAIVAIATALVAQISVPIQRRIPAEWVGATGVAILAGGIASLIPLDPNWDFVDFAVRAAIIGAAQGLLLPSLSAATFARSPEESVAESSAAYHLVRTLGIAAGPAVVLALWSASTYQISGIQWGLVASALIALIAIPAFLVASRSSN